MLLSQISVSGSLQLLGIVLVSMLIGGGAMTLRQLSVRNRLRRFHRAYGAGYMTPDVDALLTKAHPINPGGSGK
jgi:hypothetical protein